MIISPKINFAALFIFLSCFWAITISMGCQETTGQADTHVDEKSRSVKPKEAIDSPQYQQMLIVTTESWSAFNGTLRKYEWGNENWKQVGEPIPIVVGAKGLAWGKGVVELPQKDGPVKKEGDLKSPAGVFELGMAFGYAAVAPSSDFKYEYLPISPSTMCIEDQASKYYNKIVDESNTVSDWTSTDHMLRKDDLYEWGIFVNHNAQPPTPGQGSCIFMHIWRNEKKGTAGCTAMEKEHIKALIEWLDSSKNPRLIQLPVSVYSALSESLDLPPLN